MFDFFICFYDNLWALQVKKKTKTFQITVQISFKLNLWLGLSNNISIFVDHQEFYYQENLFPIDFNSKLNCFPRKLFLLSPTAKAIKIRLQKCFLSDGKI